MAPSKLEVQVKPDAETLAEIEEMQAAVAELTQAPFNYDFIEPFITQAAELLGMYHSHLVARRIADDIVKSMVYDLHRVLWGIAPLAD